jgi:hypothetical protein
MFEIVDSSAAGKKDFEFFCRGMELMNCSGIPDYVAQSLKRTGE